MTEEERLDAIETKVDATLELLQYLVEREQAREQVARLKVDMDKMQKAMMVQITDEVNRRLWKRHENSPSEKTAGAEPKG